MARKGNGIGNPSLFRLVAVTGFALFLAWFYILVASELTASAGFPHPTMRHIAIVLGLVLEMVVVSLFTDRFFRFRYRLMPAATLSGPLAIGLTCVFALPQPAFPLFYAIAGFTLGLQASIWGQFSEVLHDGPNDTLMIAGCIIAIAYVANAAFYRSEFQMTIGLFAPIASITLYLLAIRSPLLPANARTAARDAAKQAADECREQKMKEKKRGGGQPVVHGLPLADRKSCCSHTILPLT